MWIHASRVMLLRITIIRQIMKCSNTRVFFVFVRVWLSPNDIDAINHRISPFIIYSIWYYRPLANLLITVSKCLLQGEEAILSDKLAEITHRRLCT